MNVAVIGATGRTGSLVVAELLRRGHTVTALVRDPAKLQDAPAQVALVQGSVSDPAALRALLEPASAVVSALGPTARQADLHTPLARTLVGLLPAAGIRRFIGISGAGVDAPGDRKGRRDRVISAVIRATGGDLVKDKTAEYAVYAASDFDYTLVRPPRLLDGPAKGAVYSDPAVPGRSSSIRRADLAVFIVDCLEQDHYLRAAPFVSAG